MELNLKKYLKYLDSTTLTENEKFDLIEYVWRIVSQVCEKRFRHFGGDNGK